jgi:hypothetical protein
MKDITREYIKFFAIEEQINNILDDFFAMLMNSLNTYDANYFLRLRAGFDMILLSEKIGAILEDTFSDAELQEIIVLYKANPVLLKVLDARDVISSAQAKAGQEMVEEALCKVPFVVSDGSC